MAKKIKITRRKLLSVFGLAGTPSAIAVTTTTVVKAESVRQIPSKFPGKPKFWFGDVIRYRWFSSDENKMHWETGEVMGVTWHPEEKEWLYTIQWLYSTANYTSFPYPTFDEYLTGGGDFELVTKEG